MLQLPTYGLIGSVDACTLAAYGILLSARDAAFALKDGDGQVEIDKVCSLMIKLIEKSIVGSNSVVQIERVRKGLKTAYEASLVAKGHSLL